MADEKTKRELAVFTDFATLAGYPVSGIVGPYSPGVETGMDVVDSLDGKTSTYRLPRRRRPNGGRAHADAPQRRAKKSKRGNEAERPPSIWAMGSGRFRAAPHLSIKDKIEKARKYPKTVDELWLLVCAQDPRYGATGSTFISSKITVTVHLFGSRFGHRALRSTLDRRQR